MQVGFEIFVIAHAQGCAQTLLKRYARTVNLWRGLRGGCLVFFGKQLLGFFYQTVGSIIAFTQYDVVYQCQEVSGYVAIHHFRCWIDYAHVHALLHVVVEEHGVHGLAQIVVATKGE